LIKLVKDPVRRAELASYTIAFNVPYFTRKLLQTYFKEKLKMYEHWENVPVVGDLIKEREKEGEKKGEKRGEKKGMVVALQKSIFDLLTSRFGHVNGKTARLINAIDEPKALQALFRQALKTKSLDTFKEMLDAKKPALRRKAA
jgi:hypothetical protein